MFKIPSTRLLGFAVLAAHILARVAHAGVSVTDPNFALEVLHRGNGMTAIAFGPGGRMYVLEKQGRVLVFRPNGSGGYLSPSVFADLTTSVDPAGESGLLGLALDPDFPVNRFMYLFYTTSTDQRLVRVESDTSFEQMIGSELVLLNGLPRSQDFHKAGDIHFHPSDPANILISVGDDNQQSKAQDLDFYPGKLLRVSRVDGSGLSDNPFFDGNPSSVRSRVWARGFRNPWRFTFHPNVPIDGVAYVSENGQRTDRVSWVQAGSNGSWSVAGDGGGFLSPPDPTHKVMTTVAGPTSSLGIAIVRGGAFSDPDNPGSDVLYVSNWLSPQGSGGSVRRFRLTGPNLDTLVPLAVDGGQPFVLGANGVHLIFGPDGAMYLTRSAGGASLGASHTLTRVRFVGGDPPTAAFSADPDPPTGFVPLSVTFTDASVDSDGVIASRVWDFGDGASSTEQNPAHVFDRPGSYVVRLSVTDNTGLVGSAEKTVRGVQAITLTLRGRIFDGRNLSEMGLASATALLVYQQDGITPIPFAGGAGPSGNGISVPVGGAFDVTLPLELPSAGVVISAGEGSLPLKAARSGFVVPPSASILTQDLSFYLSDTAVAGIVSDTRGGTARVDLGVARRSEPSASSLYALAGGRDYLAGSGIPTSGVAHRVISDPLGYYYVPIQSGDGDVVFHFDVVADTGADQYVPSSFDETVGAGSLVVHDVSIGLLAGGAGCEDLSAITPTFPVDYTAQIEPLWTRECTGCHNSAASNNAALDLEQGSHAHLVNIDSAEVSGRKLVVPGQPENSFLFEKINCQNPQVGTRMRPTEPMSAANQALVRAWIAQGARLVPEPPGADAGVVEARDGRGGSESLDAGGEGELSGTKERGCGCTVPSHAARASMPRLPLSFLVVWIAAQWIAARCFGVGGRGWFKRRRGSAASSSVRTRS